MFLFGFLSKTYWNIEELRPEGNQIPRYGSEVAPNFEMSQEFAALISGYPKGAL